MKRFLPVIAGALLIIALVLSSLSTKGDQKAYLADLYPDAARFEQISRRPEVYEARDGAGSPLGYVSFGSAPGYGGPIDVAVAVGLDGSIGQTELVRQSETPTFLQLVLRKHFLNQFADRPAAGALLVGDDVQAVTGATVSSRGITNAVRTAAHGVAAQVLKQPVASRPVPWKFGLPEVGMLGVILLSLLSAYRFKKVAWFRTLLQVISVLVLGIWLVRPLSLPNLAALLMGFWPGLRENLLWYLLIAFAVGVPLVTGRNLWCAYTCPFAAAQDLAKAVGGGRCRCQAAREQRLRQTRYVLLFIALLISFAFGSPALGSYEPFAALFGLKAKGAMWFLLFAVLVGSALRHRFWCHYFCPVGAFLDTVVRLRQWIKNLLRGGVRWKGKVLHQAKG